MLLCTNKKLRGIGETVESVQGAMELIHNSRINTQVIHSINPYLVKLEKIKHKRSKKTSAELHKLYKQTQVHSPWWYLLCVIVFDERIKGRKRKAHSLSDT